MATPIQIVIDCADRRRLAEFWAAALGYVLQPLPEGSWEEFLAERGVPQSEWNSCNAVDPDWRSTRIFFKRVPEAKTVNNRLHIERQPVHVARVPCGPIGTAPQRPRWPPARSDTGKATRAAWVSAQADGCHFVMANVTIVKRQLHQKHGRMLG